MHKTIHYDKIGQAGFALLDVLTAIAIFALLLPGIVSFLQMTSQSTSQNAAASHMEQVATAAKEYVLANHNAIVSAATATSSYGFSVADLRNNGYLLSSHNNRNPWNQDYNIYALNPEDEDIHLVVLTTGGRGGGISEFENKVIPTAAARIGSHGGYVPTGQISGQSSNVLQGAYGGWSFALSGTDIPNPGAGHLAYSEYIDQDQFGNDYLYRSDVPGHSELNRMTTELDMDGNTVLMGDGSVGGGDGEGVRKVNFENHEATDFTCNDNDDYGGSVFYDRNEGLYVCRMGEKVKVADEGNRGFFQEASIRNNGESVEKPTTCSNSSPQIFVAPTMFAEGSTSDNIKAVQAWAEDDGANWTVRMRILTDSGWTFPGPTYGKILTITKCS